MPGANSVGRLSGSAVFDQVRKEGKLYRTPAFDMYARRRDDKAGVRLGMAVSRRVGSAVDRNRWKRLVRAYVRLQSIQLGSVDLVVIPRKGPPGGLGEFAKSFEAVWRR